MNLVEDCLNKVKKDCYKFIKTQETYSDKFKNKDRMLKDYLVPMSFWIAKKNKYKETLYSWFNRRTRNWKNYYKLYLNDNFKKIL